MFAKQGSLLLAWTYATARATRLGHSHVAAHQVALSFWLIFALILDGAAVSAQVLMGRAKGDAPQVQSLIRYMTAFAALQGVLSTAAILLAGNAVPRIFTPDPVIRAHLVQLMPHLAFQQILVSVTLVMESLVIGANEFNLLAIGTSISTLFALRELQQATTVVGIWSRGIVMLFAGRLLTAVIGVARIYAKLPPPRRSRLDPDNAAAASVTAL
jgi:Na+-driven multidrug efflux pump